VLKYFSIYTPGVLDGIEEEEEAVKMSVNIWYVSVSVYEGDFLSVYLIFVGFFNVLAPKGRKSKPIETQQR